MDECGYELDNEVKRHEVFELTWDSTLLLCLRCILGSGTLQDVHDRLEYFKLVFAEVSKKKLPSSQLVHTIDPAMESYVAQCKHQA